MNADDRAAEIVSRCRRRLDVGEAVDPEAVIREHPDLAATLRARFGALRLLDRAFRPATPDDADGPSLAGRTLGPYRLVSVLGSGGMGTVYLADGGRPAAVKVIHPHLLARPGFFKRFLREAAIGRSVRHENVVATLDADAVEVDGRAVHFLVMEHVEGQTLRSLLDKLGRVPEELCRHVGREVAKGLAAIHAAGAIHRDVKPENVLITRDHVVKVMDLGVARLAEEAVRLSQTGAFVGSVLYGAPEQFRRGDLDGRADLYGLGLTLYELATGRHPFADDDVRAAIQRQMHDKARPAAELNPQLSPFFEEVLATLLAKDPDGRFASARDLAEVLSEGERSPWWRTRALELRAQTRRPLRRIRIPRETALYGRDAELAGLRALWDRARSGDGQVVLVEGEAGIGKSRLVDEFVGGLRAEGEDVEFLFGGYPPGGAATAAGAFTTAYREHFGDDEAALREALPQTPLLVPAFAALLRGDATPAGAEPLTKDSLQTVFVHVTRSLAARRTTIVLVEDLHFAPDEGRSLFAALALAVPGHRVLLVGTARQGLDETWLASLARLGHATRVAVPRLGAKDLVRLLRDALRSEHLAQELSGKIALKSDGNPWFVFEILRGLRDGQFLTRRPDGTWATTRLIQEIEVPDTVKDLVFARVASLPTEARNLLDVAACCGFEFDPVLAGEVAGLARIPSLQRLAAVEKSHRLVHSAGRRFVFDHHQVAEVLYAALPEMLREEYHGSIAVAIEHRNSATERDPKELDGAVCVELAEHFLKGGQGPRALHYLDAALTHLEKGYLNDAAVRLADRALAVPGLLAGSERGKTLLRLAERLDILGWRDEERGALDEALALADRDGDASLGARARSSLGWHLSTVSRNDEAMARLREAEHLARVAGDRRTEAGATGNLGNVLHALCRYAEAREHHERFLAFAREVGDRRSEAIATGNLGGVFLALGHFAEAREHYERFLALAREVGYRRGEAKATGSLGSALRALGRFAAAREQCERHLVLAREIGDRREEASALGDQGVGLQALGRLAESREYQERYLALAREVGDRRGEVRATGCLGSLLRALGRFAEAREYCERHLVLAREIGGRRHEGYAHQFLADLAAEQGDTAEAERRLAEALELRRAIGHRDGEADTLCARGALRARMGREGEARNALGEALALAREHSLPAVELLAAAGLAALPGGDVATALAALAAHEARVPMQSATEVRFLLWQATHDRAHLAEARRRLDFMLAHAPPDCRESMLTNVRLHREIAAAARESTAMP